MTGARFITFEGIDGAGKSTHVEAVVARLRARGATVVCTREPGGTPLAERVREIFLHESADVLTEALLAFAARRDHIRTLIAPALAAGDTVVCDRFTDASFAYQGGGGRALATQLEQLEAWVQEGLQPDLTIWFDLDPSIAAARRKAARAADRFEQQDVHFFNQVHAAYQARMEAAPHRFARIDAAQPSEAVSRQIAAVLEDHRW